jgi:hypothetical protein
VKRSCTNLRLLRLVAVSIAFVFAGPLPVYLQSRGSASVRLGGVVIPVLRLSMGRLESPGLQQYDIEAQGRDFVQLKITGVPNCAESIIDVPLEIRTNVPYQLRFEIISRPGPRCSIIPIVKSVRRSGPGVFAGAAERSRQARRLSGKGDKVVLSGPRVSMAGDSRSPSNALKVRLGLVAAPQDPAAAPWQASVRLSLEESSIPD